MDTARTINKMGAKRVIVVYRRAREQIPAEKIEVEEAMDEGVEFLFQTNVVKVIGDNEVQAVECIKTELIEVEGGRPKPINIHGSNYVLNADFVIMALGSKPDEDLLEKLELELNEWGYIQTDECYKTSSDKVFVAGDIKGEKSTVAWAARSGRNAAEEIYKALV